MAGPVLGGMATGAIPHNPIGDIMSSLCTKCVPMCGKARKVRMYLPKLHKKKASNETFKALLKD